MTDPDHIRAQCAQETEAAERRLEEWLDAYCRSLQRQILRDYPRPAMRRHPSGLVAPPYAALTPWWLRVVAQRASQALMATWEAVISLGELRVSRGPLGHSRHALVSEESNRRDDARQ